MDVLGGAQVHSPHTSSVSATPTSTPSPRGQDVLDLVPWQLGLAFLHTEKNTLDGVWELSAPLAA